jgi:hypothetical protein
MPGVRGTIARAALASVALLSLASCARLRRDTLKDPSDCEFVVRNQTAWGMHVRLVKQEPGSLLTSSSEIGMINGGELLTHRVPCSQEFVWVRGVPIPSQVGWPLPFPFADAIADLIPGQRVSVALHWP